MKYVRVESKAMEIIARARLVVVIMITVMNVIGLILPIFVAIKVDDHDAVQFSTPHLLHSHILSSLGSNSSEDGFNFKRFIPEKIKNGVHKIIHKVEKRFGLGSNQENIAALGEGSASEISGGRGSKSAIISDPVQEKSKMSNDSNLANVRYGFHKVKGVRNYSKQAYIVANIRKIGELEIGLFATFDGYMSREIPSYLHEHLFDNIITQFTFFSNTIYAVKRGYRTTNTRILRIFQGYLNASSAITAFLMNDHGKLKLVVANVGNSRVVICCKNGKAKQLSVDHVGSNEMERKAIKKRGGEIIKTPEHGLYVSGIFPLTRAFGCSQFQKIISCDPNVVEEMINDETEFLVLASGSLWKVMSNKNAVDSIKQIKNARKAAQHLIQQALNMARYRPLEDISCVVVRFR